MPSGCVVRRCCRPTTGCAPHLKEPQLIDLNVSDDVTFVAETKELKAKTKLKTFQNLLFAALTLYDQFGRYNFRWLSLDGDEFSAVGCVDVGDTGGVVDGCGVARGCFIAVVFSA